MTHAQQVKAPMRRQVMPWVVPADAEYMAVLALASILNVLPSAVRVGLILQLARLAGALLYKLNRLSARCVRDHLRCLFDKGGNSSNLIGSMGGSVGIERMVREQLVMSSWNALILHFLPSLRDEHVAHLLQIEGLQHLDEQQKQGHPILLLGAHYGAYGYAVAATLAARGYPLWLVGYGSSHSPPPRTSRIYNRFYWPRVQRLNQRIRMLSLNSGEGSQSELSQILSNRVDTAHPSNIVYLLADQYFVRAGQDQPSSLVPLKLLNHTVYLDVSGVQLAKRMGAQPLTAIPSSQPLVAREQDRPSPPQQQPGGKKILIEPMAWQSAGTGVDDVAQDLQAYLERLEQRLMMYPALWRDLRRSDLLLRLGISS